MLFSKTPHRRSCAIHLLGFSGEHENALWSSHTHRVKGTYAYVVTAYQPSLISISHDCTFRNATRCLLRVTGIFALSDAPALAVGFMFISLLPLIIPLLKNTVSILKSSKGRTPRRGATEIAVGFESGEVEEGRS